MVQELSDAKIGVAKAFRVEYPTSLLPFEVQCCWIRPGSGSLVVTGSTNQLLDSCVKTAHRFLKEYRALISDRLGLPLDSALTSPQSDFHVHLKCRWDEDGITRGHYTSTILVAMVSLLTGRRPRNDLGVLGSFSVTGVLHSSLHWSPVEIDACVQQGIRCVVLSDKIRYQDGGEDAVAVVLSDGRPKLQLVGCSGVIEALQYIFRGEGARMSMC